MRRISFLAALALSACAPIEQDAPEIEAVVCDDTIDPDCAPPTEIEIVDE